MSNMLKFLRIICIWICCAFCLLERIQLPAVTAAIATPFEYFDDHDELSYDLDTEQSKAKYDTRLLSEQMLKSEKSTERYDEIADSHANIIVGNGVTNTELDDDTESEADADVDDLQPHERAASCHNNGYKYTHGQKVPRLDPCEVCLCMDGEIFCWWELCTKRPATQIKGEYHSNSQQDTSTVTLNEMSSTLGTTVFPTVDTFQLKQQQQKYHDLPADSSSIALNSTKQQHEHISDISENYEEQKQQTNAAERTKSLQHATKSWQKKKMYQQQQKQKHEQQKPQRQHKHTHEHAHVGATVGNTPYYVYPPSSGSKILSFPENLPSVLYHDYRTEEHQHHQHQHHQQHLKRQQKKLELQLQQKQQQQQRNLKQQQKTIQHKQSHSHYAWQRGDHHSPQYQHDIFKTKLAATNSYAGTPPLYAGGGGGGGGGDGDSNNFGLNTDWGLVYGNENVYVDTETDSDILPEPPTKKPKMIGTAPTATNITYSTAAIIATTAASDNSMFIGKAAVDAGAAASMTMNVDVIESVGVGTQASGHLQQQQQILQQIDNIVTDNKKSLKMNAPDASSLLQSSSGSSPTPTAAANFVVDIATPASAMSTKIADENTAERRQEQQQQQDAFNRQGSEEHQDDAFHRWLTSTETNKNNNNNNGNNSSNKNNNRNSLEEDSTSTARRPYLFSLAGAHDINTTTAIINNQINVTNAQSDSESINSNNNKNNNKIDSVDFRSSYNDYSSEYNGSVVNIDILLTTSDEQQQQSQLQKQKPADFITQSSSNSQQTTATSTARNSYSLAQAINTTTLTNSNIQTNSPERQCNVMGTLYKIGDVLPQDTGNCLQCVCIDGSTSDDTPRVTCSPHNCPPLVLPDLFDATGY